MKHPAITLLLATAALLLGACSTVDSRIREKQSLFNTLAPVDQANIKQGIVGVDYTPDMVYMAMGKPDSVKTRATAEGESVTWIYNQYYREYMGRQFVGYRRDVYFDSRAKVWRVYYTPVNEAVYRDRVDEVARVIFRNGKVHAIEQAE